MGRSLSGRQVLETLSSLVVVKKTQTKLRVDRQIPWDSLSPNIGQNLAGNGGQGGDVIH